MPSVVDFVMVKTGNSVWWLTLLIDSATIPTMSYAPCLEHMTVAVKDPAVTKPKYRLVFMPS